jgi:Metallo-beta-lactamase superfamily
MPETFNNVTVRMYRGILGDCFLLRVRQDGTEQNMLIDCGVLQNVQDGATMVANLPPEVVSSIGAVKLNAVVEGKSQINRIANDIADTLRGPDGKVRIDVLVVTHEHYDHISGFSLARHIWEDPNLEIGKLWMAWTENERDEDANLLRSQLGAAKHAVVRAAMAAQVLGAAGKGDELDALNSLADFIGPLDVDGMALGDTSIGQPIADTIDKLKDNANALALDRSTGKRMTTAETMAMLKAKAGAEKVAFLEPGQIIPPSDNFGLKAYVFGPPRNIDRIKKDSPSSGAKSEVYLTEHDQIMAVEATARRMLQRSHPEFGMDTASSEVAAASAHPFAPPHSRPYVFGHKTKNGDNNKETPERLQVRKLYEDPERDLRIDAEWLAGAEALALKLDSDTNNTSLVLAFELPDEQRSVLLFPGDAQVGNWMSWGDQKYPREPDDTSGAPQQTVDEILSRVIFYKVGHHASHNATAKARGLELMTNSNMVAAIPLVEAVAQVQGPGRRKVGRGWKMPYDHLHERLMEKTDARIVQGDGDPKVERKAFARREDSPGLDYESSGLWVELSFKI